MAIGNFDGVHLGHRAVLARAAATGAPLLAYTFEPAPTAVLAPERHQARITTLADRVRLLVEAGASSVIIEPFTRAWAAHPARWFAEEVLARRLGAAHVIVGWDFRFGMERGGDPEKLRAWLPRVDVQVLDAIADGSAAVSSSRVRRLVQAGEVAEAARLLGRAHTLHGTVVAGERRGRTIGFPTANLENEVELVPALGVYAVRAEVDGGPSRAAVTNVGTRPTVGGQTPTIETHILDFDGDLYGCELRISLVARIRDERRFESLDALRAQIAADVAVARTLL